MRNTIAAALTALVLALTTLAPAARAETSPAVEVVVSDGRGAGVYIGRGHVLTAGHVVEGSETATVRRQRGADWTDTWEADVLWVDKARDFALLRIKAVGVDLPAATLDCERAPLVGDDVTVIGWPRDLGRVESRGYVAGGEAKRGPWRSTYVLVAPVTVGNSGGPVFGRGGAVVGLVVGVLPSTSLALMTPVGQVCAQLQK